MCYKQDILLTLDYELFFGEKSGSINKCLIEPVNIFLKTIDNIKPNQVIFFIDAFFLFRLRTQNNLQTNYDYSIVKNQIINLYQLGYKIELHTHSHWIDAVYNKNDNQWYFPSMKKYKLQDIELYKDDKWNYSLEKWIKVCIQELQMIIYEVDTKYSPLWFRAGGWTIEPFDKLANILKKNGIKYDSSIAHDFSFNSSVHKINFHSMPNKASWSFNNDIRKVIKDGHFTEIPITSYKIFKILFRLKKTYFTLFTNNKLSKETLGDGKSISSTYESKLKKFITKDTYMLNLENLDHRLMLSIVKGYTKEKNFDVNDKIVFIGHPKGFSMYYLEELRLFLEKIK